MDNFWPNGSLLSNNSVYIVGNECNSLSDGYYTSKAEPCREMVQQKQKEQTGD